MKTNHKPKIPNGFEYSEKAKALLVEQASKAQRILDRIMKKNPRLKQRINKLINATSH